MSVYDQFSAADVARTRCGLCDHPVWAVRDPSGNILALPCTNPTCPRYRKPEPL